MRLQVIKQVQDSLGLPTMASDLCLWWIKDNGRRMVSLWIDQDWPELGLWSERKKTSMTRAIMGCGFSHRTLNDAVEHMTR